jgi:LemA protein
MEYEKELLEKVTALRTKALSTQDEKQKVQLDKEITSTLGSIMVAVENYPDLKANENMLHLQHTLAEVEEQISAARRAYNQAVTDYNNALEMVPTNFMANIMGYKPKEIFSIDESQRENIDLKKLFDR